MLQWMLRRFWIPGLVLALAVSGSALGCGPATGDSAQGAAAGAGTEDAADGESPDEAGGDESVPVAVTSLGRGRIEAVLRFSTNLEAEREVRVVSEAQRQVRQLLVEEGDDVRRGQVLLRLQDEAQRTALARVESQLEKARREFKRQERLYEQQLISEQVFNEARYELEQLELALADARRELSYTEVRAPISGTVTGRFVNLGDQVTINQHLFDIVDFDSIVARVYVPEKELARIEPGQPARVFAAASGGDARRGEVVRLAPRVDPRSGTVKVTVSIPRGERLLPGMYVSVELVTDVHESALLVPKRALVHDGDQTFVFRLAGDAKTVERLRVRAVLEDRQHIEPGAGLSEGDRIVVAGQAGLKDGSQVRLIEPLPDTATAAQTASAETAQGEAAEAAGADER